MQLMKLKICPDLAAARGMELNMNALAASEDHAPEAPSRWNDPGYAQRRLDVYHRAHGVDFTHGGHMEDRPDLWRGHYHHPGRMRHLGIDINLPAQTKVTVPCAVVVVRVISDQSHGGWGGCVFMRMAEPYRGADYLIYAHLSRHLKLKKKMRLAAGDTVGWLGTPEENGGWFAHLHVQLFTSAVFDEHWPELEKMDGYGPNGMADDNFPDPTGLVLAAA